MRRAIVIVKGLLYDRIPYREVNVRNILRNITTVLKKTPVFKRGLTLEIPENFESIIEYIAGYPYEKFLTTEDIKIYNEEGELIYLLRSGGLYKDNIMDEFFIEMRTVRVKYYPIQPQIIPIAVGLEKTLLLERIKENYNLVPLIGEIYINYDEPKQFVYTIKFDDGLIYVQDIAEREMTIKELADILSESLPPLGVNADRIIQVIHHIRTPSAYPFLFMIKKLVDMADYLIPKRYLRGALMTEEEFLSWLGDFALGKKIVIDSAVNFLPKYIFMKKYEFTLQKS